MKLNLIDLFKKITWAKNGDLTDFSQTNYEAGWAHLGDDTPTVQDFNYVQQMNDKKDQWLFNQLKAVLDQAGLEATEKNVTALRDAILALSKGYSQPKGLNAETLNFIDETGHSHEIAKASLEQAGLVQLSSATNSNEENKAATPKAVKTVKDQLDSVQRNQGNYIPNSKKSNAVNSNSADDVATSVAVKTAYDKAVSADNNANGRVSKDSDTMTGTLTIIGNAKKYKLGEYSWRKAIDFSGDTLIGNEITCIAFNNNGQLHFGGKPNASGANAYLDESILLVKGDVKTGAGKSLNKSVSIDDFITLKSESGWSKLPTGLIIQWGQFTPSNLINNETGSTTFPLRYPDKVLCVVCGSVAGQSGSNGTEGFSVINQDNSKFQWRSYWERRHKNDFPEKIQWISIGY